MQYTIYSCPICDQPILAKNDRVFLLRIRMHYKSKHQMKTYDAKCEVVKGTIEQRKHKQCNVNTLH
jgi:hypothetical protein